ncbi:thiamine-phosphate kinase [Legionella parisiensis]|uniref:Thiamine-monophosphate kinase n=1 Tax=Legionella parisiensis TaxID=45071 RepID=A0A1E5JPJ1_9GAMM|nr:thiamine-phosphate kinase [Legionella parisiensis]KTD42084.1 Thiamine-monophosphate kinase [Legionella parisiensis]OEH46454.1 Thiamine-monophosphate kinase [Legionella parisiensis]STX75372.1 Thiamine-monophosphate kinase [Legionella parisiensis]
MNEFSLIDHFFKPLDYKRDDVLLGIGDDAACVRIDQEVNLLVSTDTLVSGVHFLPQWSAYDIAYKSVMVNVSDMAAMAADPCWVTLSLTLPELNQQWLTLFTQGLKDSLSQFNMTLIGGDTTRGPLSITLTVFGTTPKGQAISRGGAKPGDIILVSGELGAAALAIKFLENQEMPQEDKSELMNKLMSPKPRIDLVDFLRRDATAAIDISDGLSADLNHICVASNVGACLNEEAIPVHALVDKHWPDNAVNLALTGGDDYELCFTIPANRLASLMNDCKKAHLHCSPIGVIEAAPGLRIKDANNHCHVLRPAGYSHF